MDNSGSMQIGDGHRIVRKDGKSKAVACTRWEEIKETVKYHAQMASVLDCPTIFQVSLSFPQLLVHASYGRLLFLLGNHTSSRAYLFSYSTTRDFARLPKNSVSVSMEQPTRKPKSQNQST